MTAPVPTGWRVGVAHADICSMRPKPRIDQPVEWGRESCAVGACVTVYAPIDPDDHEPDNPQGKWCCAKHRKERGGL